MEGEREAGSDQGHESKRGRSGQGRWEPQHPTGRLPGDRALGRGCLGAATLTPGAVVRVVAELDALGLRVEDVGAAALFNHVLLEAGVDANLGGARGKV